VQVECGSEHCGGANCPQWSRWRVCLKIVDTWMLCESARDESGLESLNRAVCAPLGLEHPAVVNGANTWQTLDKLPCAVALMHGHLLSECLSPLCSITARHGLLIQARIAGIACINRACVLSAVIANDVKLIMVIVIGSGGIVIRIVVCTIAGFTGNVI